MGRAESEEETTLEPECLVRYRPPNQKPGRRPRRSWCGTGDFWANCMEEALTNPAWYLPKKGGRRAIKMTQKERALVALAAELGSVPSSHMTAHNCL